MENLVPLQTATACLNIPIMLLYRQHDEYVKHEKMFNVTKSGTLFVFWHVVFITYLILWFVLKIRTICHIRGR